MQGRFRDSLAKRRHIAALLLLMMGFTVPASAQDPSPSTDVRPAVTTFWGDTGLWFVPTAEVIKKSGWAFVAYHTEQQYSEGRTNVAFHPATFAIGVGNRVEIFGALRAVTRVDRDINPLFGVEGAKTAGVVNEYPRVRQTWTGSNFGDIYVGSKINLMSEHRRQPMALALRGTIKLPTASTDNVGSGEFDYVADLVASKEINQFVELSAYGGYVWRGNPAGMSLTDGERWGAGVAFGSRSALRFTTELYGELPADEGVVTNAGTLVATDGSIAPTRSPMDSAVTAAAGLTWQHPRGVLVGIGATYAFGVEGRNAGLQLRLGFHSGTRVFTPPPPLPPRPPAPPRVEVPPPPPAPVVEAPRPVSPPPPPANRPPTVRAQCDPCRVEVGQSLTLRATAQDPDGDTIRMRWSGLAGTMADPLAATTQWRAQTAPGTVVLTVAVDDGRGGTASDRVTVEVIPLRVLADVLFDLDKATLRPDALRTLTVALKALNDSPTLRLHIEGYASPEGSPEYNKALGERRARAVRDYLTARGIDAARLTITSYGEERLKYDTSQEASRALNRRAALVID
jgi:peptidoglycan-associated lipoprotein